MITAGEPESPDLLEAVCMAVEQPITVPGGHELPSIIDIQAGYSPDHASAPCSCDGGRVFLHGTVWTPCNICDGTGDRMKSRNYRDGWNAALAESGAEGGALRKEVEVLRGLLAAQRAELGESQITYDQRQQRVISQYAAELTSLRSPTKELIEPLTGDTKVIDTNTGRIIETRRAPAATEEAQEAALEWLKDKPIVGMLDEVAALIATARALATQSMRDAVLRWHEAQFIKYRDLSGTNPIAGAHMTAHEQSIAAISALNVDKGEQQSDNRPKKVDKVAG